MEQVEVEITGMAITARYGTLNTGDVLRTDKAFAAHLVDDCGAAKYVVRQAVKPATPASVLAKTKAKSAPPKAAEPPAEAAVVDQNDAGAAADVCTDLPAGDLAEAPA